MLLEHRFCLLPSDFLTRVLESPDLCGTSPGGREGATGRERWQRARDWKGGEESSGPGDASLSLFPGLWHDFILHQAVAAH